MLCDFGTWGLAAINGSHKLALGVKGEEETHTTEIYNGLKSNYIFHDFSKTRV